MKKLPLLTFSLISTLLFSCATSSVVSDADGGTHPAEDAILWQQTSAEYKALCLQAFNMARIRIEMINAGQEDASNQGMIVVMDLDETVLDNSPYSVKMMREGKRYSESSWDEWVRKKSADLIPGAKEFIDFLRLKNIDVYYISNRDFSTVKFTLQNLAMLGIETDISHLMLKESNSKEERREKLSDYNIVLMLGDNLADFSAKFEDKQTIEERSQLVTTEYYNDFGRKFILLPNPVYGDWMDALENTAKGRDQQLDLLRGY